MRRGAARSLLLLCVLAAGCDLFDDDDDGDSDNNGNADRRLDSACDYCRDRDDDSEVRVLLLGAAGMSVAVSGPGEDCQMYSCDPDCPTPETSECEASSADPSSCAEEVCGTDDFPGSEMVEGGDDGQAIVTAAPGDSITLSVVGDSLTAEATCVVAADVHTNWSGQAVATLVGQGQLDCGEGFD